MEEPIDAVALGLKRGPRGAVALVSLVAISLAIVAVRSVGRTPNSAPPVSVEEESPDVVAPAPLPPTRSRQKRTAQPQKKLAAPLVRGKPTRAGVVGPAALRESVAAPETVVPASLRESVSAPDGLRAETVANEPTREPAAAAAVAREVPSAAPPASESVSPASPARLMDEDEAAPPLPPPIEPEEAAQPEPDGNGEAIARAIAAEKRAAVRACFESELKQSPKLHGTVVVELELAPPNRVNGVRVKDDLQRAAFTSCVAATMRDVRFAALDEEISVSVPYVLTPATK